MTYSFSICCIYQTDIFTLQPSLFAGDVDFRIVLDYDKVRRPPNETEYMFPKNITFTMEPRGMTIHLDNLFNGNKFLGK